MEKKENAERVPIYLKDSLYMSFARKIVELYPTAGADEMIEIFEYAAEKFRKKTAAR